MKPDAAYTPCHMLSVGIIASDNTDDLKILLLKSSQI